MSANARQTTDRKPTKESILRPKSRCIEAARSTFHCFQDCRRQYPAIAIDGRVHRSSVWTLSDAKAQVHATQPSNRDSVRIELEGRWCVFPPPKIGKISSGTSHAGAGAQIRDNPSSRSSKFDLSESRLAGLAFESETNLQSNLIVVNDPIFDMASRLNNFEPSHASNSCFCPRNGVLNCAFDALIG
jgi:hypothetical protein